MTDYRSSHASTGYGTRYQQTYRVGYYHAQWEDVERPLLSERLHGLREAGAASLLDFACGTGRITKVAEEIFPRVVGVDVSASMLAQGRLHSTKAELIERDLTRQPLDERFDVATAFRFFLNAEPLLRVQALRALHHCLHPTGTLVANVHVNASSLLGLGYRLRNRVVGHDVANVLSLNALEQTFAEGGFAIHAVHWYSFLPRVGWFFPPGSRGLLRGVERVAAMLPVGWQHWSQSFLVMAKPVHGGA